MTNIQQTRKPAPSPGNPMGWPEELLPFFERAITVEYASLTRAGAPVTYPLTPYVSAKGPVGAPVDGQGELGGEGSGKNSGGRGYCSTSGDVAERELRALNSPHL